MNPSVIWALFLIRTWICLHMYQKLSSLQITTLGKIRKFLNTDTTKSAIVSLVTSRLDYCNGLLCGITDELLCRLQKVQNNAARVVSGSRKYDHITPVLKNLHWLPIRKRIMFKILFLTFKCMQGCALPYLRELLVKQANTRTLRSNIKNLLQIPLTNLKRFGDRAFCAYAPLLWNELPDNTKAADSVQNFKKQLKTLLFRKEFNWLYGPWQLFNDSKALLNIRDGKGRYIKYQLLLLLLLLLLPILLIFHNYYISIHSLWDMEPCAGLHILAHRSISLPYLPNLCAVLRPAPLASYYFPFLLFPLLSPCIGPSLGSCNWLRKRRNWLI